MLLAATLARADEGLDLAVLVDASASMGRDRRLEPLLLRMMLDLMARNASANRVEHRLAAIAFGSTVRVDVPFTPVRGDNVAALTRRIETLPAADLGDTDVLGAFAAAASLFHALPPDPQRRRAIVLLTDGVPYVRGADMTMYRERLLDFTRTHVAASSISVDVLLIAPGRSPDPKLWQSVANHVEQGGAAADTVLAAADAAVTRVLGTRTVGSMPAKTGAGADTLVIPPYLEVVVFDVFRGARDAEVLIFPPGAMTPLRAGVEGVEAFRLGDVLATLVVPRPPPGEWTIRRSHPNARVRILSQQFFPRGVLLAPRATDSLRQYDRVTLRYCVTDSSGEPLRELAGYALSADVALLQPNGSAIAIATDPELASGSTAFRGRRDFECQMAGRYWADVRMTTADALGHRLEVFRDRWSGFSVAPATRIDCRVSASAAVLLPAATRIDCAAPGSRPVELRRVAVNSPTDLFRAVVSRDGAQTDGALELRYDGGGVLRGWLHGACRAGTYRLQLTADRTMLRAPYAIRIQPEQVLFVRQSPWPWLTLLLASCAVAGALLIRQRRTTKP